MNEIINIALNNLSHLDPIILKSIGGGATLLFFSSIAFYKVKKRKQKNNKAKQLKDQLAHISEEFNTENSQAFKLNSSNNTSSVKKNNDFIQSTNSSEPSVAQLLKKNSLSVKNFNKEYHLSKQLSFDFGDEDIPTLHDVVHCTVLSHPNTLIQPQGNIMDMSTQDLDLFLYHLGIQANEEDKLLLSEDKKQKELAQSFQPSVFHQPTEVKTSNVTTNYSALADLGTMIRQESENLDKPIVAQSVSPSFGKTSVWVNWMLVSNGKTLMKRSMLELLDSWGTAASVMQLEDILSQEAQNTCFNNEHSWSVLSVFPVEKS